MDRTELQEIHGAGSVERKSDASLSDRLRRQRVDEPEPSAEQPESGNDEGVRSSRVMTSAPTHSIQARPSNHRLC